MNTFNMLPILLLWNVSLSDFEKNSSDREREREREKM